MYSFISNIIDSLFRTGKNCYPKVFLECKYVVMEKKMPKCITDDMRKILSHEESSDEENYSKE